MSAWARGNAITGGVRARATNGYYLYKVFISSLATRILKLPVAVRARRGGVTSPSFSGCASGAPDDHRARSRGAAINPVDAELLREMSVQLLRSRLRS